MNTLLVAVAISLVTAQDPISLDKRFDDALGVAGLSTKTARFDPGILGQYGQGEFSTMLFDSAHLHPWRTPFYVDMYRRQIATTRNNPIGTLSALSRLTGDGSRRALLGNPIAGAEQLSAEPDALRTALGRLRSEGLMTGAVPSQINAPVEVKRAAALIVFAALDSVRYRRAAFADVLDLGEAYDREINVQPTEDDPQIYQQLVSFYRTVEMNYLYAAAQDMAAAVEKAEGILKTVPETESYDVNIATVWGDIVLSGGGDSTHDVEESFILFDTGGRDTYVNPASNQSIANWLSVCIDTDGNDLYVSDKALLTTTVESWPDRGKEREIPGPASAMFGLSFLIDSEGDDIYRTHRPGLGSATFGVAMMVDKSGADTYDAYADAQGFAKFGVGVLEDHEGDDRYLGFTQVQGVGITAGVGALIDREGDDVYIANDTVIDFPSPQSPEHNVSLSQGAGYGFRSDYLTGHSLSGGVGLLYDQAGDDEYECAVFGQGVGYWESIGMLIDEKGNDKYHGLWYVQGGSAHYAIGYLEDMEGDDTYVADMNMAQGAGHDFSIGYLLDHSGDDLYTAPNLSLGAGNANGIGVFVDFAGNDEYITRGTTLGKANPATKGSIRERALCLGVFIDLGGSDTYPLATDWAVNGVRVVNWTDQGTYPAESQVGVFWDGAGR